MHSIRIDFCIIIALIIFLKSIRCDNDDIVYRGFGGNPETGHGADLSDFADSSSYPNNRRYSMLCMDIKPQHSVDIDHIVGMWYGSEIIMHTQDVPGVYRYDTCVIIYLSDITKQMNDYNNYNNRRTLTPYNNQQQHQQQQHRQRQFNNNNNNNNNNNDNDDNDPMSHPKYLRLVWSEKDDNLEYTFNYTEHTPGLWHNVGEQRGSLVALNQYIQFTGSVQVVKAVNDHLVLTFCGNDARSSIYTIVLSRNPLGLTAEELRSIRNLLSRRGLGTESIRKVCNSSDGGPQRIGSYLLAFIGVLYYCIAGNTN